MWTTSKVRVDTAEEESSNDDDEDAERNTLNDEGALLEAEKEVLNVHLTDLLANLRANPRDEEDTAGDDNGEQIVDADDDNETTAALKASLAQTSPGSRHNRHLSLLLEKRLRQNEDRMRWEVERHERYQQRLRSRASPKKMYVYYPTIPMSPSHTNKK